MKKNTIENLLKDKIFQSIEIEANKLPFSKDVLNACMLNHCGKFGSSWTCPPAVGSFEEVKSMVLKFKKAFIFNKVFKLEDSFDIEGMNKGRDDINILCDNIIDLLIKNNISHKVLKAGSCSICKVCTYPNKPCRNKERACPSVEACGISVVDLAKQNKLNYFNGVNTVTYFAIVLYN